MNPNLINITTEYIEETFSRGSQKKDGFISKLRKAVELAVKAYADVHRQLDAVLDYFVEEEGIPSDYHSKLSSYQNYLIDNYQIDPDWNLSDYYRKRTLQERNYDIPITTIRKEVKKLTGATLVIYALAAVGLPINKQRLIESYDPEKGILKVYGGTVKLSYHEKNFINGLGIFEEGGPWEMVLKEVFANTGDGTLDRGDVDKYIKDGKKEIGLIPEAIAMCWRVSYCVRKGTRGYERVIERQMLEKSAILSLANQFYDWYQPKAWISYDTYQACISAE